VRTVLPLLLLGACRGALPPGDPTTPDLVLVSIDTLRADHLSSYGCARPTSPFLDRLAAAGVRWSQARSPSPWTLPTHVTLLSGWLPTQHGVVEDDLAIPAEVPLLAEAMAARGFATAGIVSSLYVSERYGFERGFETFDAFGIRTSQENLSGQVTATDVVDRALAWLRSLPRGKPAFLFVHFYDAHYPYAPPKPFSTLFDRAPRKRDAHYRRYAWYREHPLDPEQMAHQEAQYDEAIRYVDSELERLHGALTAAGRPATWAVTADHGEEFGERGSWGHAHTLYPEQLHVPLILSGARIPAGESVDRVVGLQDLPGGLAVLSGADMPTWSRLSLDDSALRSGPQPSETSRFDSNRVGLWSDGWRLDLDLDSGTRELYDTTTDPGELHDRAASEPERVADMERDLWGGRAAPWTCRDACTVQARRGLLVVGEAVRGREALLAPGEPFQVVPSDAEVRIAGEGRWYRAGVHPPPPDAALILRADLHGRAVDLDPQERARLEALGYMQPEDEEPVP